MIRIVTVIALAWAAGHVHGSHLARAPRRMLQAFGIAIIYGGMTLFWTADDAHGLHDFLTISLALGTAAAVVLLVRQDRLALRSFALGFLMAGAVQVGIAIVEIATGSHATAFGAAYLAQWRISNLEAVLGRVAWGTLGNPNDLGGLFLFVTAVLLSARAFGLRMSRAGRLLGAAVIAASVVIGLTSLEDARAYRLGLITLVGMHLLDRLINGEHRALRIPVMLLLGLPVLAAALFLGGSVLETMASAGDSNALRLSLVSIGLSAALSHGGLGSGLGTEKAMIDSGEIPLNFHNVVVQLAAEMGLVLAGLFLAYLLVLLATWVFVTRSSRLAGRESALARAAVAAVLLIYGVTSSGVLESPTYWTLFAVTAVLTGLNEGSDPAKPAHDRSAGITAAERSPRVRPTERS